MGVSQVGPGSFHCMTKIPDTQHVKVAFAYSLMFLPKTKSVSIDSPIIVHGFMGSERTS